MKGWSFLLVAAISCSAQAYTTDDLAAKNADMQVRKVTAAFQTALAKKDRPGLIQLFLDEKVPVTGVASDATMAIVRTKKADASKLLQMTSGEFADSVGTAKTNDVEKFSNVKIHTDGAVASVYFDFVFESDGKPVNLGSETWLLVDTDSGWKISSIAFSMNFPAKK
jgi:hypothetical protein